MPASQNIPPVEHVVVSDRAHCRSALVRSGSLYFDHESGYGQPGDTQ